MTILLLNPNVLGGLGFDVNSMRLRSNDNLASGGRETWAQFEAPGINDEGREACESYKDCAAFYLQEYNTWYMVRACLIAGATVSFRLDPPNAEEMTEILDTVEELRPSAEVDANEAKHLVEGLHSLASMFTRAADYVLEVGELRAKIAEYEGVITKLTENTDNKRGHGDHLSNDIDNPLSPLHIPH